MLKLFLIMPRGSPSVALHYSPLMRECFDLYVRKGDHDAKTRLSLSFFPRWIALLYAQRGWLLFCFPTRIPVRPLSPIITLFAPKDAFLKTFFPGSLSRPNLLPSSVRSTVSLSSSNPWHIRHVVLLAVSVCRVGQSTLLELEQRLLINSLHWVRIYAPLTG